MKRYEKNALLYLNSILILLCLIFIFIAKDYGDELNYHYPNAKNISLKTILNSNSNYSSAYTPLPYFIGKFFLKIKDSIIVLRLLNLFILLLSVFVFFSIVKNVSSNPLLFTLLFLSNPYLLRASFTYYLFSYGMFFSLCGIYFYFFSPLKHRLIYAHMALGLAVLSQQWMLVIIFSISLMELNNFFQKKISFRTLINKTILKILSIFPSLLLFWVWKGFTHPNLQTHSLHPSFEHFNAILANLGFIMIIYTLINIRFILDVKNLKYIFILPIIFLSIPIHSSYHGITKITGLVSQLSTQIEKMVYIPYKYSMFLFCVIGFLFFLILAKENYNDFFKSLFYSILGFSILFIASTRLGASHIFISLPFILILISKKNNNKKYLWGMVIQFYLISIFYIVYVAFFRSKGISF